MKKHIWEEEYRKVKRLCDEIWELYKELEQKGIVEDKLFWLEYVASTITPELQRRTGCQKLNDYAAYHPLIGSTTDFNSTPQLDFPNNQIVNFIREVLEKLQQSKETGELKLSLEKVFI